jgi:hypothetical protein
MYMGAHCSYISMTHLQLVPASGNQNRRHSFKFLIGQEEGILPFSRR